MKTLTQQVILACVRAHSGQLSRSALAKLLAGSKSVRIAAFVGTPFYGRLAQYNRKTILYDIDVLLQQRYLQINDNNMVVTVVTPPQETPQN